MEMQLGVDDLLRAIAEGTWAVSGRLVHEHVRFRSSEGALVRCVPAEDGGSVRMSLDLPEFHASDSRRQTVEVSAPTGHIFRTEPWQIEVREVAIRREQVKKAEGGGWREVPYSRTVLRLEHVALREEAETRELELRERAEEAATAEQARRLAAEIEENGRRQAAFHDRINERCAGKVVLDAQIDLGNEGRESDPVVRLRFTDGTSLDIAFDMRGCEGGYCCATVTVDGQPLHGPWGARQERQDGIAAILASRRLGAPEDDGT